VTALLFGGVHDGVRRDIPARKLVVPVLNGDNMEQHTYIALRPDLFVFAGVKRDDVPWSTRCWESLVRDLEWLGRIK